MYQRPKPGESEEDLLKQYEEFKSQSNKETVPAARVVRVGKRKTEEEKSIPAVNTEQAKRKDKPKSKFAESRSKKKKEGVIDHTILAEAASREGEKSSVLSSIVARNVPSLSSTNVHWNPIPNPHGFPKPPKLNLKATSLEDTAGNTCTKKKSLYMKQMEKELGTKCSPTPVTVKSAATPDENLGLLGQQSFILDGKSGLGKEEEAKVIHQENISKLAEMTHEERLRERDELMSRLSAEQIEFLQSMRRTKGGQVKPMEGCEVELESQTHRPGILKKRISSGVEKASEQPMELDDQGGGEGQFAPHPAQDKEKSVHFDEQLLSELPIPPKEAEKWVHMNKVELDKLKWMTNVPEPKPLKGKEGYVARFNFQGDLLPYVTDDISWNEGLHHHGEEPGRAGYTLDELFVFVRSQVIQQRHLGLKTLGNIIRNANEGLYDACFETPILQLMIDAGVVLLFRFAIDESVALVHQQALRALYFLVSSEPDERCLSIAEPWVPMSVQPGFSSFTHSREKVREELDAEEKELKDVEVIKLDVIRALVRMDIHIRLRYLLESETLLPPDVIYALGILKRIARHSLTAAWTLVKTPRLLAIITQHFLPHNPTIVLNGANIETLSSVYGVPLSQALSFMKVLASRGRHIAATLIEQHDIISRVMAYVSMEPTEIQMPISEVLLLAQEAYGLWAIFLSYGLAKSQQSLASFYPLIVKQLIFYRDKVDLNHNIENNQYNYEIGAHLVNVLTKGLCVAATKTLLTNRMKRNEPSISSSSQKEIILQPPILDWEEFGEILNLVEVCATKWMNQLHSLSASFSGFKLLGSFCNFLNAYIDKWRDQSSFEGVVYTKKINHILSKVLSPIKNNVYENLLKRLREHSALSSPLKMGQSRDPTNLSSLASVCEGGKVTPILQKDSPFPLLLPLTNLLRTLYSRNPSLDADHIARVLNNNQFKCYLNELCRSQHFLAQQWFSRIEIITLTNMLSLSSVVGGCDEPILLHQTALTLLPLVHKGDERIVKSLLTEVVCHPDFTKDLADIETQIDGLKVAERHPLKSPAITQPTLATNELTKRLMASLISVGQDLVKNLLHSTLLEKSLLRHDCIPFLINDLSIEREESVLILDHYWSLMPLKLLRHLNEVKTEETSHHSKPETIVSCSKWMQMTYLILRHRNGVSSRHTTPMGWFRHLSYVFLASNDLFLEANIISYVQACMLALLEENRIELFTHSETVLNLPSSYDWYKAMLEHYESVSYGDSTFAFFIIIPLLRKWPIDYKLLLFSEHAETLRFIRLSLEDVTQFIPLEHFLSPTEDNEDLVFRYRSALGRHLIREQSTFLYHFVSHHVKEFVKTKGIKKC